jgi:Gram-negative bacterial TonB protein C-terminal
LLFYKIYEGKNSQSAKCRLKFSQFLLNFIAKVSANFLYLTKITRMHRLLLLFALILSATFTGAAQTTVNDSIASQTGDVWNISPTFPGGMNAFTKYVESNLNPTANGKLFVRFTIETDGKLSNIQIVKSINEETDNRLIQVLEKCPAWIPGALGDKPVRTGYLYPIIINSIKN